MTILEIYELGLKDRLSAAGCSKEDIESASRKCREDMKPFLEELHCLCELGAAKEPVAPILSGMISEKIKEFSIEELIIAQEHHNRKNMHKHIIR